MCRLEFAPAAETGIGERIAVLDRSAVKAHQCALHTCRRESSHGSIRPGIADGTVVRRDEAASLRVTANGDFYLGPRIPNDTAVPILADQSSDFQDASPPLQFAAHGDMVDHPAV